MSTCGGMTGQEGSGVDGGFPSDQTNGLYRQLQATLSFHMQPLDDEMDDEDVVLEEVEDLNDHPVVDRPSHIHGTNRHSRGSSVKMIGKIFPWISSSSSSSSSSSASTSASATTRPRSHSLPSLAREVLEDRVYLYSLFQRACVHQTSQVPVPSTLPQSAVSMVRRILHRIASYLLVRATDIARSGNRRSLNANILLLALDSDVDLEVLLRISSYTPTLLGTVQEETISIHEHRRSSRTASITSQLGHLLRPTHTSFPDPSSLHPTLPMANKVESLPPKLAILSGVDLHTTSPLNRPRSVHPSPPKVTHRQGKRIRYAAPLRHRTPSEQPLLLSVE
ncbi:hypothetical protein BJ684DRAFT_19601 [Piptocephalis cylindrospora]|uniref:Uncharacterized protein n=1 Tax=Piptocephalis cylindrospora TaxID=1907219 RepID=A0A4V1IYB2_9FUNG|nr:hypothetical protein BJ684DRAFT_19601 [Piptocephalis cylindrospora]|eukprot:RKP13949.1 hypothetical protein BJ684DRAFT_19601 [Piptocephalis cylindrospora]